LLDSTKVVRYIKSMNEQLKSLIDWKKDFAKDYVNGENLEKYEIVLNSQIRNEIIAICDSTTAEMEKRNIKL